MIWIIWGSFAFFLFFFHTVPSLCWSMSYSFGEQLRNLRFFYLKLNTSFYLTTFSINRHFQVWDLDRPLECDATLQILKFDDDEGKQVNKHFNKFFFSLFDPLIIISSFLSLSLSHGEIWKIRRKDTTVSVHLS